MKTIIKRGNTSKYKTECYECGCVFIYESNDVYIGEVKYGIATHVTCPDCGEELLHDEYCNILTDYEYDDEDETID